MMDMDIIKRDSNMIATLPELSKFVLVGREQLVAMRAQIRALKNINAEKSIIDLRSEEARMLAEDILDAKARLGEMLKGIPKASGDHKSKKYQNDIGVGLIQPKKEVIKNLGFSEKEAERLEDLADNVEIIEQVKAEARERNDLPTQTEVFKRAKEQAKKQQINNAKENILYQTKQSIQYNKPQVYNMHCEDWLDIMQDCDLLLTDPPYSTDVDDIDAFVSKWFYKALSKVKPTGRAYIFIGAYPKEVQAYLNSSIPEHIRLEQLLVWTYKNTLGNNPKDRYKLNYQMCLYFKGVNAPDLDCPLTIEQWAVQEINAPDGRVGDRYHPWQKPIEISDRFIRHSTKEGDIILDPFVCTGTFIISANKLNRQGFGCDINMDNLKIAIERGCELIG